MDRIERQLALLLLDPLMQGSILGPDSIGITRTEPQRFTMYSTWHEMWNRYHEDWSALVAVYVSPSYTPTPKLTVTKEELRHAHRTFRRLYKRLAKSLGIDPANYFTICTAPSGPSLPGTLRSLTAASDIA